MRKVRFLLAPKSYDLYLDEIIDYADSIISVSVEDLGLKIETVVVESDNSVDAVRTAQMKMFNQNKGFNFVVVGVTW